MSLFENKNEVSDQVDLTVVGDVLTFTPGQPIDIVRWGIIADALIDVGAGLTVKMDHRPSAGSETGRTDGTPTTAVNLTTIVDVAQGKGIYVDMTEGFEVDPGEQVVFQVTDAADTAGTGLIFIEYRPRPFQNDATLAAASNRLSNMTKTN